MDSIFLNSIEIWTRIGMPAGERKKEQRLLVSIELFLDLKQTAANDDPKHGIDYDQVLKEVLALAKTERKTIERFAEDIAAMILKKFKPDSVKVTVQKFPFPSARSVSVIIHQSK